MFLQKSMPGVRGKNQANLYTPAVALLIGVSRMTQILQGEPVKSTSQATHCKVKIRVSGMPCMKIPKWQIFKSDSC